MGIEFRVRALYVRGKLAPGHVVTQREVRGVFSVAEEDDPKRHRRVKVARVMAANGREALEPLYDAVLLSVTPEWWTLTGIERVLDGPLLDQYSYAQSWVLIPCFTDELIAAERKINELSAQLHNIHLAADADQHQSR